MSAQCAHVWAGGEVVSSMFDLGVASCALCDVRLVLVLPVFVSIPVRLMLQLASEQTWKTTMSNIVELVGQIKDRNSVTEFLLEQLRCGVRCDNLEC
jgi:hypothetical protein